MYVLCGTAPPVHCTPLCYGPAGPGTEGLYSHTTWCAAIHPPATHRCEVMKLLSTWRPRDQPLPTSWLALRLIVKDVRLVMIRRALGSYGFVCKGSICPPQTRTRSWKCIEKVNWETQFGHTSEQIALHNSRGLHLHARSATYAWPAGRPDCLPPRHPTLQT